MKPRLWLPLLAGALLLAAASCLPFRGPAPVSNDRCHVCHLNYSDEKLAVTHARHGIGCERCHGPSDDHCGSESHEIAPDILYPLDKVKPACMQCHPKAQLARQDIHCLILAPDAPLTKTCTGCHGAHRLPRRTVRWDKATRKLLPTS